jgi:hypothetical protein
MHGAYRERTNAIKIVIAGMSGLLGAVVRSTLSEESDMEVVAQVSSSEALAVELGRPVDVVVTVSASGELSPVFQRLLFGPTPLPVVAISPDGKRIDVFGRSVIHGEGLAGLTNLIREAVTVARPRM